MSEFGLTLEGFKRKRLDLLLQLLNDEVRGVIGSNANLEPESIDGEINGIISESNALLWELAEMANNSYNPAYVTGVSQDNLYALNGITRLRASPSRTTLVVNGSNGTFIPQGSLVSTSDTGSQFITSEDVTIPSNGSAAVSIESTETGPIVGLRFTINTIDSPITGWTSCVNLEDATLGTNRESDADFRARREGSVARDAQSVVDAIFAEIRSIAGTTQVLVLENDTQTTDTNGVPPRSVHAIVIGGDDDEIARAIFVKKTLGIRSFGNTSVDVTDIQGRNHIMNFTRPTGIDIFIRIEISTFGDFPESGADDIKQAIIDYAAGNLIEGRSIPLGGTVIHSELYTPINTIPNHTVDSLKISTSTINPNGNPNNDTSDINISIDNIAVFIPDNIEVIIS